jgi:hypothetical protein
MQGVICRGVSYLPGTLKQEKGRKPLTKKIYIQVKLLPTFVKEKEKEMKICSMLK